LSDRLLIFDCDGVLVDSEPVANHVLAEELRRAGLDLDEATVRRTFVGLSLARSIEIASERLGRPLPPGFEARLEQRTADAFRRELRAVPGVAAALDRIDVPTCVASSGSRAKMRLTLGLTGLLERFEGRLFSATEVARGKPFPDLFLHAAASMGGTPSRTVVVEDSVPGVRAGVAAGMAVVGFAGAGNADELASEGALVIGSMDELPAALARVREERS